MVRGTRFGERAGRLAFRAAVVLGPSFVVLPLVLVAWLSFFSTEILSLPPKGYSPRWYRAALEQPQLLGGLRTSFVVSFGDLEVSLFLVAPGQTTLPIAIL